MIDDINIKKEYLKYYDAISKEYSEIGNFFYEDKYISFSVYRGYYYDCVKEIIISKNKKLLFEDKYDDPYFTLIYKVINL